MGGKNGMAQRVGQPGKNKLRKIRIRIWRIFDKRRYRCAFWKSFIARMLFFEIPQERSMAEAHGRRRKVKIAFF